MLTNDIMYIPNLQLYIIKKIICYIADNRRKYNYYRSKLKLNFGIICGDINKYAKFIK